MTKIIIGIDPGLQGGIAAIQGTALLFVEKMPVINIASKRCIDGKKIAEYLKPLDKKNTKIYIERVHSFPNQGVTSMFTFGEGFGKILGVLEALEFEYEEILPKTWQKTIYANYEEPDKNTGAEIAKKLFPEANFQPGKMMKYHNGMTDALMIALYGGYKEWG